MEETPSQSAPETAPTGGAENGAASNDIDGSDQEAARAWRGFAIAFVVLVAVFEVVYHAIALETHAFWLFTRGLALATGNFLDIFYDGVSVRQARVSMQGFTVTVDYGCDGLQVVTLLTAAVLAFPATLREKLVGLVLGILWLQAWNVVRIGTLVIIGTYSTDAFDTTHVYIWPTILVIICLVTWMGWARWTFRNVDSATPADA